MSKFFNTLSWFNALTLALTTISGIVAWYFNFLYTPIHLPLWQLLLLLSVPHGAYFVARWLYWRKKQNFKIGDPVSIVADNRKFIVIRYHLWLPQYLICKAENKNDCICVHQKYASPYIEPQTFSITDVISNISQQKRAPHIGRIQRL